MEKNKQMIRLLQADEIECRIATIKENGLSLLLYKDARVDQKILDETFGPFGWKRSHQSIDGNLYCTVEILDKESGAWISKQDVGTTGYTEKEKSQASDSFKRACFNWGIGRELYTAPFIWVSSAKVKIEKGKDAKCYCKDSFMVSAISYNEAREITALTIITNTGNVVYEYARVAKADTIKAAITDIKTRAKTSRISSKQIQLLQNELDRTGVELQTVKDRYHFDKAESMSPELYERVMNALSKTKALA